MNKLNLRAYTVLALVITLASCGGTVDGYKAAASNTSSDISTPTPNPSPSPNPTDSFSLNSPDPVTSPIADNTQAPTAAVGTTLITSITVDNTTNSTQTNIPLTFGHAFKLGDVASGGSVTAKLSNDTYVPLQVDIKATHNEGSIRHAVISTVLPSLAANSTETIGLIYVPTPALVTPITAATFLSTNPGFTSRVYIRVGEEIYSASARTMLAGSNIQWLAGPTANEWIVSGPLLKVSDNVTPHPHLTVRFAIRSFTGSNKTKVDVTLENSKTFTAGSQNFTYDSKIFVGGVEVDSITALEHYKHARWHKSFWWGEAPQTHIKHNTAYLIATKAVPNYDQTVVPAESALANMASNLVGNVGPMKVGLATKYMPQSGARPDIGPLPGWSVLYLLSMDKRAKDAMLATADGAGSWEVHYRDETSTSTLFDGADTTKSYDLPVRVDKVGFITIAGTNYNYNEISVHPNANHLGPLPLPRCQNQCITPFTPDVAHQPSLVYLAYLVTGDYFYLEELQFWASWNVIGSGAAYYQYEKALVKWQQVRGQAWSMRTLGQVAYITPDAHPLKLYLADKVATNLTYYTNFYTVTPPNLLGVVYLDETPISTVAPWQDDFFTWSIGYLTELNFSDAQTLFAWKAKFPVGRMTTPGYCWIAGSVYQMQFSATYTLEQAYAATAGNIVGVDLTTLGSKACASADMAAWLTTNSTDTGVFDGWGKGTFTAGSMLGYSTTATSSASDMQPALAVAASTGSGITNAPAAWSQFVARTVKPDYSSEPQFAIVPR
jgi:hypothetical protein